MKIEQSSEGKIKITLNDDDMKKYDITFAGLDYNRMDTKRVVWELLAKARSETGFDFSGGSLLVEAFPGPGDGCTIYFTGIAGDGKKGKLKLNRNCFGPYIYVFDGCDELLDCVKRLKQAGDKYIAQSKLFENEGKYYLAVSTITKLDSSVKNILGEYGRPFACGRSVAFLEEHFKTVADEKAIEKLTQY